MSGDFFANPVESALQRDRARFDGSPSTWLSTACVDKGIFSSTPER
jgi:hypothetical protein